MHYTVGACSTFGQTTNSIVDSWNLDWISTLSIHGSRSKKTGFRYAKFAVTENKKQVQYKLHRVIARAFDKLQVDHINNDTLDNRECNLRIVSAHQNGMNKSKRKSGTSKYKGVKWHKRDSIWESKICYKYKDYYLGRFENEIDAARAYDMAALKFHKEYANINFNKEDYLE